MHHQILCILNKSRQTYILVVLSTRTIPCIAGETTPEYNDDMPPGERFLSVERTASCTLNTRNRNLLEILLVVTEVPITDEYVDVVIWLGLPKIISMLEMKMLQQNSSICQRKVISFRWRSMNIMVVHQRNGEIHAGGVGDGFDYEQNNSPEVVLLRIDSSPIMLVRWISMEVLNVGAK